MKFAGDLSEAQKAEAEELTKFERLVDGDPYPNERKAQLYVMVAHDWFMLDMEEEGNRLLLKANTICPGYFTDPMIQHQLENPNFDTIIKGLTGELRHLLMGILRNK